MPTTPRAPVRRGPTVPTHCSAGSASEPKVGSIPPWSPGRRHPRVGPQAWPARSGWSVCLRVLPAPAPNGPARASLPPNWRDHTKGTQQEPDGPWTPGCAAPVLAPAVLGSPSLYSLPRPLHVTIRTVVRIVTTLAPPPPTP